MRKQVTRAIWAGSTWSCRSRERTLVGVLSATWPAGTGMGHVMPASTRSRSDDRKFLRRSGRECRAAYQFHPFALHSQCAWRGDPSTHSRPRSCALRVFSDRFGHIYWADLSRQCPKIVFLSNRSFGWNCWTVAAISLARAGHKRSLARKERVASANRNPRGCA